MYYEAIVFVTVFMQILLILSLHGNAILEKRVKKIFIATCILLVCATICEWLGIALNGAPLWTKGLHRIVKILEFCVAPFIPVFCMLAAKQGKKEKIFCILATGHIILEVLFMPFDLIVHMDENNTYVRGPLYGIYIATYLIALIGVVIVFWQLYRQYRMKQTGLLVAWTVFIVCCTTIQTVTSAIKIDWLCISIAMIVYMYSYIDLVHHVDGLTKLLNRTCYKNHLYQLHKPVIVQYFDVNEFKFINDNYGHSFGDMVLEKVADQIGQTYSKQGRCYRIGGDEFCIMFEGTMDDLDLCNKQFVQNLDKCREAEPAFPTMSLGAAQFDPAGENILDAVERADQEMYKNKRKHKEKKETNETK